MSIEREKQVAAEAAADLIENGMTVGLGTGSTVAYLLPALAKRALDIVGAATSPRTEHAARELGLRIEDVTSIDRFDITIDGADQVAPDGWLVKGGGGAHTREKIVAGAADRFVVIADSSKPVPALHAPVPLELLSFGLRATLRRVGPASLRDVPLSPDGGVIADYHGPVEDPAALAVWLSSTGGRISRSDTHVITGPDLTGRRACSRSAQVLVIEEHDPPPSLPETALTMPGRLLGRKRRFQGQLVHG